MLLNKIYLSFSILQGNLSRHTTKKNGGNVRFINRNRELLYKEQSQWQDIIGMHATTCM